MQVVSGGPALDVSRQWLDRGGAGAWGHHLCTRRMVALRAQFGAERCHHTEFCAT